MKKDIEQTEFKEIEGIFDFSGKEVLEIGCGNGRFTSFLAKKCKRLAAIDLSEKEISDAKEKFPDIDFRIGAGENLEFEDGSFDAVVFSWSLHHHSDPAKSLKEAARVLKDEGRILINEPMLESEITKLFHIFDDEEGLLKKAAKAISGCSLAVEKEKIITTKWSFDDVEDIYEYLKDQNLDEKQRKEILDLLGEKKDSRPIIMNDVLKVVLLRK
jgi:ubiquinone/menaquinone biosynthesis C-methylase UbiE